jgi:hypothetical protein
MLFLTDAVRAALALGIPEEVPPLLAGGLEQRAWRGELAVATGRAALAEHAGRPEEAARAYGALAEGWAAYGARIEVAFARLGRARCFAALGLGSDRRLAVEAARAIVEQLGAHSLALELDRLDARPVPPSGS